MAINAIVKAQPDLLFVDIELPSMSGLQFCSIIRGYVHTDMKVVFYTSHDEYMLEALRLQAFDYLQKPFTTADLSQIILRYYQDKLNSLSSLGKLTSENNGSMVDENVSGEKVLGEDIAAGNASKGSVSSGNASSGNDVISNGLSGKTMMLMVVNVKNESIALKYEDVIFFRFNVDTKLWEVICNDNRCYGLRHRSTADVIIKLNPNYAQCHKRYIVNVQYVNMVYGSTIKLMPPLQDLTEITISRGFRKNFMDKFYSL